MMLEHMKMDALIQYAILSLGLIAALLLFLALKKEMEQLARRHKRHLEELETRLRKAENRTERQQEGPTTFQPPRSGFNLNHRIQALRLLRRGEEVAHVAAALGVPRVEVELLIRVQKLGAARLSSRT